MIKMSVRAGSAAFLYILPDYNVLRLKSHKINASYRSGDLVQLGKDVSKGEKSEVGQHKRSKKTEQKECIPYHLSARKNIEAGDCREIKLKSSYGESESGGTIK